MSERIRGSYDDALYKSTYTYLRDLFKFWKITDNILETVTYSKSYVAYRMAPIQMTLSDLEGHFCCLKPF